jgi:hypothetical protein
MCSPTPTFTAMRPADVRFGDRRALTRADGDRILWNSGQARRRVLGYQLDVDREQRLARVTLFGSTSVNEQIAWIRALVAHPDWAPEFNLLLDARALVGPLGYVDLSEVTVVTKELDEQLGTGRHALVGDTQVLYGCCRMAERVCQPCSYEVAPFRTMAEAEHWLGIAPQETDPHSGSQVRKCEEAPPKKVSDSRRPG